MSAPRRPVVQRAVRGQGPTPRRAAAGVPERSDSQACVPLYAQTWLLAQSGRIVV
jgi:hypothetical protein